MNVKTLLITTLATLGSVSLAFGEPGKCKKRGAMMSAEKRAEIMAKFDADGDGKLNEEERKAAMEARKKEFMEKWDANGDGEISEEEKSAARDARRAAMMKKFDTDGDGELSDEEKKAARAAMGGRKGCNKRKKSEAL